MSGRRMRRAAASPRVCKRKVMVSTWRYKRSACVGVRRGKRDSSVSGPMNSIASRRARGAFSNRRGTGMPSFCKNTVWPAYSLFSGRSGDQRITNAGPLIPGKSGTLKNSRLEPRGGKTVTGWSTVMRRHFCSGEENVAAAGRLKGSPARPNKPAVSRWAWTYCAGVPISAQKEPGTQTPAIRWPCCCARW